MSRKSRLIFSVIFAAALFFALSTTAAFAADANPDVVIVNPVDESTSYSSNLLLSVKLTAPIDVQINLYQKQKAVVSETVGAAGEELPETASEEEAAAEANAAEPETTATTAAAANISKTTTYADITAEDWQRYTKEKAAGKEAVPFSNKEILSDTFSSDNDLSFYTKKLENIQPGVYQVCVSTIDETGSAVYINKATVLVGEKIEKAEEEAQGEEQQGFLKNLLKGIFGN